MSKCALFAAAAAICLAMPASAQSGSAEIEAACTASFASEGGFLRGKTMTANVQLPGTTSAAAVQRIAQALSLQGHWRDLRADRDIGTISANMGVTGNDDASVPLNVVVQDREGGASAQAVVRTRAGLMVQESAFRDMICDALAAGAGA